MRKLILFVATGAGTGYVPVAPGTAGAAVGLFLHLQFFGHLSPSLYLLTLFGLIALAIWTSEGAAAIFGRPDPKEVTIDEVAGIITTLAFVPSMGTVSMGPLSLPLAAVLGFILFRIFDILKPFPIRRIEHAAPGGYGIVLDDVAAGIYANLCLQIVAQFFPLS